ncbi:MAG: phosphate ABC transporter substrate-binding protein PstS [Bradyrhizobiaceae bacterium]|nr:phosphate ABC transporter substrate-binding protein PstS [Bradyrhizobiaceae bacterium]
MRPSKWFVAAVIMMALGAPQSSSASEITGAGSTFVYPILSRWAEAYAAATGNTVSYQSIGSSGGITQIKASSVDFAASDMPLQPDQLAKLGMSQFPLVIGGVVPVVNLEGVHAGQMKFTGPLLADIFLGNVRKWNDPAIRAINPDLRLPDADITVVHRLDGSGTTFNWVNYLSKVSAEWHDKVGEGTSVEWPNGVAGKGNEGVALFVSTIKNSIGYVEYTYALQYNMTFGQVQNKTGRFVRPDADSFRAAAEGVNWQATKDFYLLMTDADGQNAYPITATTFILIYRKPTDPSRTKAALAFFKWAFDQGQRPAEDLKYVPLPSSLVAQIESYWKANVVAGM